MATAKRKKRQIKKTVRTARETRSVYAAPRFYWLPITEEKIRRAAQKIVEAVHPEKIILFGSHAYGHPTDDSDVDLLVVMESGQNIRDRTIAVSEILYPRPFPVDIIARTPQELEARLALGDCFFAEIMKKGKVVYERTSR